MVHIIFLQLISMWTSHLSVAPEPLVAAGYALQSAALKGSRGHHRTWVPGCLWSTAAPLAL